MVSGYNYIEYYIDAELTSFLSARPLIRTFLQNVMCLYADSCMCTNTQTRVHNVIMN